MSQETELVQGVAEKVTETLVKNVSEQGQIMVNKSINKLENGRAIAQAFEKLSDIIAAIKNGLGSIGNKLFEGAGFCIKQGIELLKMLGEWFVKSRGAATIVALICIILLIMFIILLVGFFVHDDVWYYIRKIVDQMFNQREEQGTDENGNPEIKRIFQINNPILSNSNFNYQTPSMPSRYISQYKISDKGTVGYYLNNTEPFASGMSYVNMISNFVSGKPIITYNRKEFENNTRTDDISIIKNENSYLKVYRPKDIIWKMNESEHTDFQNLPENAKQYYRDKKDTSKKLSWTYSQGNKNWDLCTNNDKCEIKNHASNEYK